METKKFLKYRSWSNQNSRTAPLLNVKDFRARIHSKAQLSLLSAVCYSGCWIVRPALGGLEESGAPILSIIAITAVGHNNPSYV